MKQLTETQVNELRALKYKPYGDELYWDKLAEIYADDAEALERIKFNKSYLLSMKAIPCEFASHWKTQSAYFQVVDEFNAMIGYTPEKEPKKDYEDCLLEEIAAKFGIDIDINGDGITSFEKYKNKNKQN